MNEILAVTESPSRDDALLAELATREADRVTVLMPGCRPESDPEAAHRMAELVARVEFVTDATVVGMAADDDAIFRDDYDQVVHAGAPSEVSLLTRLGIRLDRRGATRLRPALR